MTTTNKKNLLIVGLGGLGASLGLSLRHAGYRRLGWTRNPDIRYQALHDGVIDQTGDDLTQLIAQADLTVLALPIPVTAQYLAQYADCWRADTLVTDIGSTKQSTMLQMHRFLAPRQVRFAGSHPMAGTEKSGFAAALSGLFAGADVFVCPGDGSAKTSGELSDLWHAVGMDVIEITPERHDKLVAHTSHVPHILSSALVTSVLERGDRGEHFAGCAGGFRDTSRIASSDPVMWRQIIADNREDILLALTDFSQEFEAMRQMIKDQNYDGFEAAFAHSRQLRAEWLDYMADKAKKKKNL